MSRVLIVSKTRMKEGRVCVGGVDVDNHCSVRLHDEYGHHEFLDTCPYNIFDVWDLDYEFKTHRPLPHSNEDVHVYGRRLLSHTNGSAQDLKEVIVNAGIPTYDGDILKTFGGSLKSTTTSGGTLYISQECVPNHSVCFWVSDKDILRDDFQSKKRYNYPIENKRWGYTIPYVGLENEILDIIPKGSLIRLSFAHWWKREDLNEERCYLQMSGYFCLENGVIRKNLLKVAEQSVKKQTNMNNLTVSSILPATINNSLMFGKTHVGIDFGTSTTVVSISSYDDANKSIETKSLRLDQLLPDGARFTSEIIPSVIAWHNQQIFVGEGASRMKYDLKLGKNIWYSFKMELGEDLGAKYYDSELRDDGRFNIRNPKDAARVFFSYLKYSILKYCKENGLSDDIMYAVSIPASFEANQRRELLEALMANEMNVLRQSLIDEPNAAFISYAITRSSEGEPMFLSPDYNSKILVFDFGGGTCDISILEIGQDIQGLFSKNISISKFAKLGGDDIDRYITYHYLLPRFLEANGKKASQFRTNERKNIATKLYKIAERLKILINERLAILTTDFEVPQIKNDDTKTEIEAHVSILTSKGTLVQDKFFLTNKELTEAMSIFLKNGWTKTTQIKGEDEYNSIFTPIDSAIKKAKTPKEEIDYVLLIGGSAQSPYIQDALHTYFEDSEMLVPRNLRTHVSQGAAIHSLLLNGMNKCLIRPITSEPILIITKDVVPKIILPAGTEIPCDTIKNDDLVTSREGQDVVELPICVGSPTKILFNLRIECPLPGGFPINSPINLVFEVNADKMLLVQATCMGTTCRIEPLSPFANKELSTEERLVLQAERTARLETEANGGVPPKATLEKLRIAYERAGLYFKAAETYELQYELYPPTVSLNNLGVLYSNSGNKQKAAEIYELGLEKNPNDLKLNFNYGYAMKNIDNDLYVKHICRAYELDSNDSITLIERGRIDKSEGNIQEGEKKLRKAYDQLLKKWETSTLMDNEYGWLSNLANELGEKEVAKKVMKSKPGLEGDVYYESENLAKERTNMLNKY